jgi:hypothetical protein
VESTSLRTLASNLGELNNEFATHLKTAHACGPCYDTLRALDDICLHLSAMAETADFAMDLTVSGTTPILDEGRILHIPRPSETEQ